MAPRLMHRPLRMPSLRGRRRGQSMVEYVIILPSLLMIILGAIQMALIYQAKSTLNYAAFLAARQGALNHGKECIGPPLCTGGGMRLGLAAGLMPLAARKSGTGDKVTATETTGLLLGQIAVESLAEIKTLNPSAAWVKTASQADTYTSEQGVPNDNLMYRSTAKVGSGTSAMNLQDGNLLKIQVTYCFKLEVPFVNQIIYAANNLLPAPAMPTGWASMANPELVPGRFCNTLNAIPAGQPTSGRYLPMVTTAMVRMQSRYTGQ